MSSSSNTISSTFKKKKYTRIWGKKGGWLNGTTIFEYLWKYSVEMTI